MTSIKDDLLHFADENVTTFSTDKPEKTWRILLVDDEPDVHAATKLTLKNTLIEGRYLSFSHAYSSSEAKTLLQQNPDFAVALIDVVMEHDQAGLELVRYIRNELKNSMLRIILRTGQPGYAPEMHTISDYDINDYRTKTDLTQTRLFTSLTLAIRSYAQIQALEANRQGLEQILASSRELSQATGLKMFAQGLVTQLCALLKIPAECLVCAAMHQPNNPAYILAAAGKYSEWIGFPLQDLPNEQAKTQLEHSLINQQNLFSTATSLYFQGVDEQAIAAYIDSTTPLNQTEKQLLEVFCSNISVAFTNLQLYSAINDLAYNDRLVNLPNRNALIAALDKQQKSDQALALVDIDNFADINSILDDSFGDAVLQAVAERLEQHFSPLAIVARLSSDLFALYGDRTLIHPENIAHAFAEPFLIYNNETLRLSATTGLVLLTQTQYTGAELLKNAGAALKQAKRLARGKAIFFKEAQNNAARDRIQMLNELRSCVSEQLLQLYYQPFVCLKNNTVIGAECLLRWQTPDGKFIPPDIFIPIAEQSGLMIPIGDWVIRTALAWRQRIAHLVSPDFRVAINVSHVQFAEPHFANKLIDMMTKSGVLGSQIEIELTESIAIENFDLLINKLEQLQATGIHLSMDDFGTGYSSLSVLQRLNLNRLKIDRSFVSGETANSYNMAHTIIAMAGHLNLSTIAEGIETAEQRQSLLQAGCQDGQGYFFSKPLPETEFVTWLQHFKG